MRLLNATIPNNCEIAIHGDMHYGLVTFVEKAFLRMREWVLAKPNRYWISMGDAMESRTVEHKYFDFRTTSQSVPMQQANHIISLYKPIASRGLAYLMGNHEWGLRNCADFAEYVCGMPDDEADGVLTGLQRPEIYGGVMCKLRLGNNAGRQIAKLFLYHPHRFSLPRGAKDYEQEIGNKKAALKRFLRKKAADCVLMAVGHTHVLLTVEPSRQLLITDDGKKVKQRYLGMGDGASDYIPPDQRYYLSTGSFCKLHEIGVDNYAERLGYDPIEIGYQVATIKDGKLAKVEDVLI